MTWWLSSSGVTSFDLFLLFMVFSQQEHWSRLHFLLQDHVLSELFTRTRLSWVTLHGMAHSFLKLGKPLHYKAVIHEGDNRS